MKSLRIWTLSLATLSLAAFAQSDKINVEKFQPKIIDFARPSVTHGWSIDNNIRRIGLEPFRANIPCYNGQGFLFGSWNPRSDKPQNHITFIVMHGGHGVSPGNFATAQWLRDALDANVLILDSYWSRGQTENWRTWNEFGVNMRVLDAIAAGRWVKSQGSDSSKTFLYGDSQGGWTALRAFTPHDKEAEVKAVFKGGISIYPNCYVKSTFTSAPNGSNDKDFAPPLGNFTSPLIVFTGSLDEATPLSECNGGEPLKAAEKWINFQGATHAWDAPNRGAGNKAVDGECTKAPNIHRQFPICRSDKYTDQMKDEVTKFVAKHAAISRLASSNGGVLSDEDRRTAEILRELERKR